MKCLKGSPFHLWNAVLGKVVKRDRISWFNKNDRQSIYVATKPTGRVPKVAGYVFSGMASDATEIDNAIYGIAEKDIDDLAEGDVVLLEKDGKINVLYEVNSHQNAIFATNRCNLRCVMCPQPPHDDGDAKLRMNLSIIGMMNPSRTRNLAITGGEPTLLGDGFYGLVRACKGHLPRTAVTVLTNGKRFKDMEVARELTLIAHPMLTIAIPLYSDDDRMHDEIVGVPGSFFDVIKGLQNLALFRHRIEIRTVIHAMNYGRLPKLADFIYRNLPFVSHVALMGLEVTGLARKNVAKLWIDPVDYREQIEDTARRLNRYNMKFSIYNHQLCVLPEELWRFCRKSISAWKNTYMDECQGCSRKAQCGGFFETGGSYQSRYIHPLTA